MEKERKSDVKEEKALSVRQKMFSSVCDQSILRIDFYRRREIIDVVNKKILCTLNINGEIDSGECFTIVININTNS